MHLRLFIPIKRTLFKKVLQSLGKSLLLVLEGLVYPPQAKLGWKTAALIRCLEFTYFIFPFIAKDILNYDH